MNKELKPEMPYVVTHRGVIINAIPSQAFFIWRFNMDNKKAPLCQCGCGKRVNWGKQNKCWNKYINGHYFKTSEFKTNKIKSRKQKINYDNHLTLNQPIPKIIFSKIEIWKPIKNYEDRYEISNKGRIKNKEGKILKLGNCFGYNRIELNKNGHAQKFRVGRLVATTFISDPIENQQVNHKNGIKNDDRLENLEWTSPSENTLHSRRVLGQCRGEKNNKSKLKKTDITKIKKLLKEKELTFKEIGDMFKVTPQAIMLIENGRNWSWI